MRANVKITFICTGTSCKCYLFTLGLWLPTTVISKAPIATSAFIILIKQHGHRARIDFWAQWKALPSAQEYSERMQAGPGCVRAALCSFYPLPGLSPCVPASPRFVVTSPAGTAEALSSLSIICCFWWELDALGNPRGGWRAGKQLAIHNPPTAGMEPFAPSSCGGSWKGGFLGWGCLLLLSFGRRTGGERWIRI